jgi:hypothetical protein
MSEDDDSPLILKPVKDMSKEEIAEQLEVLQQALKDKRKRSPFTADGIRAGSTEYWRRYRAANKDKVALYQTRYRMRGKKDELVETIIRQEDVSVEEATKQAAEEMRAAMEARRERKMAHTDVDDVAPEIAAIALEYGVPPGKAQQLYNSADSYAAFEEALKDYAFEMMLNKPREKE